MIGFYEIGFKKVSVREQRKIKMMQHLTVV